MAQLVDQATQVGAGLDLGRFRPKNIGQLLPGDRRRAMEDQVGKKGLQAGGMGQVNGLSGMEMLKTTE